MSLHIRFVRYSTDQTLTGTAWVPHTAGPWPSSVPDRASWDCSAVGSHGEYSAPTGEPVLLVQEHYPSLDLQKSETVAMN